MTAIQWVSVDPGTGYVVESLPGARTGGALTSIIGQGSTTTVTLPANDRLPERWDLATTPGRALLVAHYTNRAQTPLWAGFVTNRRTGSGDSVEVSLAQVEALLDRNYVPSKKFAGTDQSEIMRYLVAAPTLAAFHGEADVKASGVKRDRVYDGSKDKTYLSAAQDLMGVINGPEFTIRWRWDRGRLVCVPTVAPRIGRPAPQVGPPPFVISRAEWERAEDYSAGNGATIVTGIASRQGDERVQVTRRAEELLDAGWLPIEYRWQPDTGSVKADVIDDYVAQRLDDVRRGTSTLSVTSHLDDFIIGGGEVDLGDDIGVDLENAALGIRESLTARLVGWAAEPSETSGQIETISPVLQGA